MEDANVVEVVDPTKTLLVVPLLSADVETRNGTDECSNRREAIGVDSTAEKPKAPRGANIKQ